MYFYFIQHEKFSLTKNVFKDFIINKKIKQLVVWGLKDSTHTHRYIHSSIFKMFNYLNDTYKLKCKVVWLEDISENNKLLNSNCLIFTSPHYLTDLNFKPKASYYLILHMDKLNVKNKKITKYNNFLKIIKYRELRFKRKDINGDKYLNDYTIYNSKNKMVTMPWATDLTKKEVEENIKNLKTLKKNNKDIIFVGTVWKVNNKIMDDFKKIVKTTDYNLKIVNNISDKENQRLVKTSFWAPVIQGELHLNSYIPCRIFKNISYGAVPITNNPAILKILKKNVFYIKNLNELFKKRKYTLNQQKKIMNEVKDYHTYESRLNTLINYL